MGFFIALTWKFCIQRVRHWFATIAQLLLPVVLFLILSYVSIKSDSHTFDPQIFPPTSENSLKQHKSFHLLYAPSNPVTDKLVSSVRDDLNIHSNYVQSFTSEEELVEMFLKKNDSHVYGIIFEGVDLGKNLKYKIRTAFKNEQTNSLFSSTFEGPGSANEAYYLSDGFATLQMALDKAFIKSVRNKDENPFTFFLQKFPYPSYKSGEAFTIIMSVLPIFTAMSFMSTCSILIQAVVQEKATGIKELMKLNGVKNWMLWLGWFLNTILINVVSIIIIVIILKIARDTDYSEKVVKYSDGSLIFVFLVLYCVALFPIYGFVTVFFNRATIAGSCGVVVSIALYFAFVPIVQNAGTLSIISQILLSLNPQMAMYFGWNIILDYEKKEIGLQWSDLFPDIDNSLSLGLVFIMLILDAVLLMLLTMYLDEVMPSKYGIAKPWNFLCSFWPSPGNMTREASAYFDESKFETPPRNIQKAIQIKKIAKSYSSRGSSTTVAVDGVSADIYKNRITALLGHNGAGKTTLVSMLTGMISPTSGTALFDNVDIRKSTQAVRKNLGFCPQYDMLFNDLTAYEHLKFFAMLKGSSFREATKRAYTILTKMRLQDKAKALPTKLSGGMKRKLTLANAMMGKTVDVLILDEPTSGLDPESRREIWDILLEYRGNSTIILTTHYMEEADTLGDWIMIMNHGQIHCYGTPLFLKKAYGTGYHLNLTKESSCDADFITSNVQTFVPNAKMMRNTETEISFSLPLQDKFQFPSLFKELEQNKSIYKIQNINVALTTLEEVFLKVGEEVEEEESLHEGQIPENDEMKYNTRESNHSCEELTYRRTSGVALKFQQVYALIVKHLLFLIRHWLTVIFQLGVPLFLVISSIASTSFTQNEQPLLVLDLSKYGETEVLFTADNTIPKSINYTYFNLVKSAQSKFTFVQENITAALLEKAKDDISYFKDKMVIAADTYEKNGSFEAIALYSSFATHGIPISINLISNTFLQYFLNSSSYSITAINHPISKEDGGTPGSNFFNASWLFVIPYAVAFFVVTFMHLPLTERVTKTKHLQLMSGISPPMYWVLNFFIDYIIYLIFTVLLTGLLALFNPGGIYSSYDIGVFFIIVALNGFSVIPFAYLFSYLDASISKASGYWHMFSVFAGFIAIGLYFLHYVTKYYKLIQGILYLFPQITLSMTLNKFQSMAQLNLEAFESFAFEDIPSDIPRFGLELIYLSFSGLLYIAIILLLDYNIIKLVIESVCKLFSKNSTMPFYKQVDNDVQKEEQRVENQWKNSESDILLAKSLVKRYCTQNVAVKTVSFGVKAGECFGLLGVNGAGKTTTFKMLTGDEIPTSGEARIGKYHLHKQREKFLSNIGYCPQFDGFFECFTARENIKFYALIRGIPKNRVNEEVKKWVDHLGLHEYMNIKSENYSGGNKRKLSTAVAVVGDVPLIFLDEPTSGVDPVSRRKLWDALINMQKHGQSILLTSHSMDECEALCNRLAIMVNGSFKCLGPCPYLKNKFAQGFTVLIKVKSDDLTSLKEKIKSTFISDIEIKDEHQGFIQYHIKNSLLSLSVLFSTMENIKASFTDVVEDYSICGTSLEEVFLSFAKHKDD